MSTIVDKLHYRWDYSIKNALSGSSPYGFAFVPKARKLSTSVPPAGQTRREANRTRRKKTHIASLLWTNADGAKLLTIGKGEILFLQGAGGTDYIIIVI